MDIGGTFTDLVGVEDVTGELTLAKESTSRHDFALGVMKTLEKSGIDPARVNQFVHGTTVIINALTERSGEPTALLTTKGFRDVLEIGRANRPDMYNFYYRKPTPFVPRRLRFEVEERMDHQGEVVAPLNESDVRRAADRCRESGVATVAVCYLHSYANPSHEKQTGSILGEEYPRLDVTLSHELSNEWREYERSTTAVLNAYVRPMATRYLSSLEAKLEGAGVMTAKYAMQSNGGTTIFSQAKRRPIYLVESGPVGGVTGATALASALGHTNLITLDIGGTTAKTSLVHRGRVRVTTDYKLESTRFNAGYPLKIPVVDIVEIGTGGGSIAWIDAGGSLKVGPISAGAEPGPASYARGGTRPTLTDANVVAGRLNPEYFLGGRLRLDADRAGAAVGQLAEQLGVSRRRAALGIIRLANSAMANALRMVSVRRGHDPRDFVMVAMGGAGGLHAGFLAEELRIGTVLVPRAPAHFSAWGMLLTDLRHDYITTRLLPLVRDRLTAFNEVFQAMEEEAFRQFLEEGMRQEDVAFTRFMDIRYVGQEHTVKVPAPPGKLGEEQLSEMLSRFHALHEANYTFRLEDEAEVVNFHLLASGKLPKPELRTMVETRDPERAEKGTRRVDFDREGVRLSTIFERDRLPQGVRLDGPAVVEEPASTTVVYPGQAWEVDRYGNLVIHTRAAQ